MPNKRINTDRHRYATAPNRMSDCSYGRISLAVSVLALCVSLVLAYSSYSSYQIKQKTAQADLFSKFQQQYTVVSAEFPDRVFEPNFAPAPYSEDWLKIRRYWEHSYKEWYTTQVLHPELYGELWDSFYSEVIGDALKVSSIRHVFLEMANAEFHNNGFKEDFYRAIMALAKKRGVSLESTTANK